MVKSTEWVENLLGKLQNALIPRGREELNALQCRWLQDLQDKGEYNEQEAQHFPPWDQLYYQHLIEKGFQIDQSMIAEFFPLERTAAAMLGIFLSRLGLCCRPIPSEVLGADVV
jgi:metallopeptidase MepB